MKTDTSYRVDKAISREDMPQEKHTHGTRRPFMPEELKKAELSWIRSAQKDLKSRIKNGDFKTLSLFINDEGSSRLEE